MLLGYLALMVSGPLGVSGPQTWCEHMNGAAHGAATWLNMAQHHPGILESCNWCYRTQSPCRMSNEQRLIPGVRHWLVLPIAEGETSHKSESALRLIADIMMHVYQCKIIWVMCGANALPRHDI